MRRVLGLGLGLGFGRPPLPRRFQGPATPPTGAAGAPGALLDETLAALDMLVPKDGSFVDIADLYASLGREQRVFVRRQHKTLSRCLEHHPQRFQLSLEKTRVAPTQGARTVVQPSVVAMMPAVPTRAPQPAAAAPTGDARLSSFLMESAPPAPPAPAATAGPTIAGACPPVECAPPGTVLQPDLTTAPPPPEVEGSPAGREQTLFQPDEERLLTTQMLAGIVPPFYVPMDIVLEEMPGYTVEHIEGIFGTMRSITVAPVAGGLFAKTHGADGWKVFVDLFDPAAVDARARHDRFRPDPALCGPFLDHLTVPGQWVGLFELVSRTPSAIVKRLPYSGPQCLIFFAQMQHVFAFDPAGTGRIALPEKRPTHLTWDTTPVPLALHAVHSRVRDNPTPIAELWGFLPEEAQQEVLDMYPWEAAADAARKQYAAAHPSRFAPPPADASPEAKPGGPSPPTRGRWNRRAAPEVLAQETTPPPAEDAPETDTVSPTPALSSRWNLRPTTDIANAAATAAVTPRSRWSRPADPDATAEPTVEPPSRAADPTTSRWNRPVCAEVAGAQQQPLEPTAGEQPESSLPDFDFTAEPTTEGGDLGEGPAVAPQAAAAEPATEPSAVEPPVLDPPAAPVSDAEDLELGPRLLARVVETHTSLLAFRPGTRLVLLRNILASEERKAMTLDEQIGLAEAEGDRRRLKTLRRRKLQLAAPDNPLLDDARLAEAIAGFLPPDTYITLEALKKALPLDILELIPGKALKFWKRYPQHFRLFEVRHKVLAAQRPELPPPDGALRSAGFSELELRRVIAEVLADKGPRSIAGLQTQLPLGITDELRTAHGGVAQFIARYPENFTIVLSTNGQDLRSSLVLLVDAPME